MHHGSSVKAWYCKSGDWEKQPLYCRRQFEVVNYAVALPTSKFRQPISLRCKAVRHRDRKTKTNQRYKIVGDTHMETGIRRPQQIVKEHANQSQGETDTPRQQNGGHYEG